MKRLITQAEQPVAPAPEPTPAPAAVAPIDAAAQAIQQMQAMQAQAMQMVQGQIAQIASQYGISPEDVQKLSPETVKQVAAQVGAGNVKDYIAKVGADKVKDIVTQVGAAKLKEYAEKLGLDKLKDLPGGKYLKSAADSLIKKGVGKAVSAVKSWVPGWSGAGAEPTPVYAYAIPVVLVGLSGLALWCTMRGPRQ